MPRMAVRTTVEPMPGSRARDADQCGADAQIDCHGENGAAPGDDHEWFDRRCGAGRYSPAMRRVLLVLVALLTLGCASAEDVQDAFGTALGRQVRDVSYRLVGDIHMYTGSAISSSSSTLTRAITSILCASNPHPGEAIELTFVAHPHDAYIQRLDTGEVLVTRYVVRERVDPSTGRTTTFNSLEHVPEDFCLVLAAQDERLRAAWAARAGSSQSALARQPQASFSCDSSSSPSGSTTRCYASGRLIYESVCTVGPNFSIRCQSRWFD